MRKLFKVMTFAFIIVLAIVSCSNESFVDKTSIKEIFKFKYQGVEYAAEYEVVDSTMIFTDPEISDIICNLESDPYVATLTYPDSLVEYFNSNEELKRAIEAGKISNGNMNSRANSNVALVALTLKVYEHSDFRGEMLTFNGPLEIPNMADVYNAPSPMVPKDFNDKISSFQLDGTLISLPPPSHTIKTHFKAIVTFYEDINYAYGSASFLIDRDHPQVSHNNFQKVKRCSYCKYNMNDRTSSIKLYWLD